MDDRYDPNLILAYVEDELDAEQRDRVEKMLAGDAALSSLVADLKRDRAALRGMTGVEPSGDLVEATFATLERQMLFAEGDPLPRPSARASRFRIGPLLTYGGIAAVLAITVAVVFQSLQSGEEPGIGALAMEDAEGLDLSEAPIAAQRKAARQTLEERDLAVSEDTGASGQARTDLDRRKAFASEADAAVMEPGAEALASAPTAAQPTAPLLDEARQAGDLMERTREDLAGNRARAVGGVFADSPADAPATPAPGSDAAVASAEADGEPAGGMKSADAAGGPAAVTLGDALAMDALTEQESPLGFDGRLSEAGAASRGLADQKFTYSGGAGGGGGGALDFSGGGFGVMRSDEARYTLNVIAPSAAEARQQLDTWARSNRLAVIDLAPPAPAPTPAPTPAVKANPENAAAPETAAAEAAAAEAAAASGPAPPAEAADSAAAPAAPSTTDEAPARLEAKEEAVDDHRPARQPTLEAAPASTPSQQLIVQLPERQLNELVQQFALGESGQVELVPLAPLTPGPVMPPLFHQSTDVATSAPTPAARWLNWQMLPGAGMPGVVEVQVIIEQAAE